MGLVGLSQVGRPDWSGTLLSCTTVLAELVAVGVTSESASSGRWVSDQDRRDLFLQR
jgi:hypothetical protein